MTLLSIFRSKIVFTAAAIGIMLSFELLQGCSSLSRKISSATDDSPVSASGSEFDLKSPLLTEKTEFQSHPEWVGLSLNPTGYKKLLKQIEDSEHIHLKDRGEAHITILTPPEFKTFAGQLSMSEIENAIAADLNQAKIEPLCVGRGQLSSQPSSKTYFVVIKAPDLLKIRTLIKTIADRKGVGAEYKAEDFYPHVTIGFTERDLHIADGVIKDVTSCIANR